MNSQNNMHICWGVYMVLAQNTGRRLLINDKVHVIRHHGNIKYAG